MDDGYEQTQALAFDDSGDETDEEAEPGEERPPVRSARSSENHKIPKYSDTRKVAVIIPKFEQCGSTVEL